MTQIFHTRTCKIKHSFPCMIKSGILDLSATKNASVVHKINVLWHQLSFFQHTRRLVDQFTMKNLFLRSELISQVMFWKVPCKVVIFGWMSSSILAWNNFQISRRNMLSTAEGFATGCLFETIFTPASAASEANFIPGVTRPQKQQIITDPDDPWTMPPLQTSLAKSRILATDGLSPLAPTIAQELIYPSYFEGTWLVTSTLKSKTFPFGMNFVPATSFLLEKINNPISFEARYVPTPYNSQYTPRTKEERLNSNSKIIADRAFNAVSISRAYQQLTPVQEIVWDPNRDPSRLTFSYSAGLLSEDMQPMGERRTEVYLTARKCESSTNEKTSFPVFCSTERSRTVTLIPGNVLVSDIESISELGVTEYDASGGPNKMSGVSRIAVFLIPNPNSREGVMWQQVNGKAVAFFDYEIELQKVDT